MQCHEMRELLSAYLDGMLDSSLQERAGRHLAECRGCRSDLDDLKMVMALVRDLPTVEPPGDFRKALRVKLEKAAQHSGKAGFLRRLAGGRWSGMAAAAASFFLVVGLAYTWDGAPWKQLGALQQDVKVESYAVKDAAVGDKTALSSGSEGIKNQVRENIVPQLSEKTVISGDSTMSRVPAESIKITSARTGAAPVDTKAAPADDGTVRAGELNAPTAAQDGAISERKLATGNGASGMSARGAAAVPPAADTDSPRNAVLNMKVDDRNKAVQEVINMARQLGGIASVVPGTGGRQVMLRIPEDQFEKAVAGIGKMGSLVRQDFPQPDAQISGSAHGSGEIGITGLGGGGAGGPSAQGSAPAREEAPAATQPEALKKEAPAALPAQAPPLMSAITVILE